MRTRREIGEHLARFGMSILPREDTTMRDSTRAREETTTAERHHQTETEGAMVPIAAGAAPQNGARGRTEQRSVCRNRRQSSSSTQFQRNDRATLRISLDRVQIILSSA